MDDQNYIKGFNAGYIIARDRPALAKQLLNGVHTNESEYAESVLAGIKQFGQDKVKERQSGHVQGRKDLQQDRDQSKDYDLDR